MNAMLPIPHDALLLGLATFTRVCASGDRKAGRRMLRRTIEELRAAPVHRDIRDEAVRGIQRACGACKGCKGA